GLVVVHAVVADDEVRGAGVVRAGLNARDRAPVRHPRDVRGHVRPRLALVLGDVNQPVVAAGPQHPLLLGRFGQRENGAVHLDAGVVAGDRPAAPLLLLLVVAGQVAGDHLPRVPGIAGAEEDVATVVDRLRVVLRDQDRRRPLETVLHL